MAVEDALDEEWRAWDDFGTAIIKASADQNRKWIHIGSPNVIEQLKAEANMTQLAVMQQQMLGHELCRFQAQQRWGQDHRSLFGNLLGL